MTNPPNGHVTFLFTDIEGSTKIAQEFPDTLQGSLDIHHTILREAIESNNGFVFEIIGDAFCAAFDNPDDAVKASIDAQTKLANEKWEGPVIKVRMGIHSGDAEWTGSRYMGYITLARTARIMSAAYGEQIIISDSVYSQLKEKTGSTYRDLGERRLKDIIKSIRLYQITGSGLRDDFPPLKTLDARPNNLPVQLTSFIGREKEITEVKELLKNTHLLTLLGYGGGGKTRLALQVSADLIDDFANGVWFIELASVTNPELLTQAVIESIDIKEEPGKTLEQTLLDYLKDKELLLILDNCEHLISEAAVLTEKLLVSCPNIKVLATSREGLKCAGEQIYRIPALSNPDYKANETPEQLSKYESVKLFIERAVTVDPKFRITEENAPDLAGICSRLDGVPLALELAAARIKALSLKQIYERLDDRFNLLTSGKRTVLPRQQTLRALIDWSYDLLTESERLLWSRLSVFSGGWTLEAAEEVCNDQALNKYEVLDLLSELTEKSIIIYDDVNERYRFLETIKQYGDEKLTGKSELLSKHLVYFMELAEKAEPELKGNDSLKWLNKLEADHANIQAAIEWSLDEGDIEQGARLAGAVFVFWLIRCHYSIGRKLLEKVITNSKTIDPNIKVKAFDAAGGLSYSMGDYENSSNIYMESLSIYKEIGNKRGIAASLNMLGALAHGRGDNEQANKFYLECLSLRKEIGNKSGIGKTLNNLSAVAAGQGDYQKAKKYLEECLTISREFEDLQIIAYTLINLGWIITNLGEYEQAKKNIEEGLSICKEIGEKRGIATALNNLATLSHIQKDYKEAKKIYSESMSISEEIGDKHGIATILSNLGTLERFEQNYEQANNSYKNALRIFEEIGDMNGMVKLICNMGIIANHMGNSEQALVLLSFSEKEFESLGLMPENDDLNSKDETIAKLKKVFTDVEYKNYWDEGKKLSIEEAVDLALRED